MPDLDATPPPGDRRERGSTAEHCSKWPVDGHAYVSYVHGGALVSVRQCQGCLYVDWDDLDAQIRAILQEDGATATPGPCPPVR